jgi:hypothetical protein
MHGHEVVSARAQIKVTETASAIRAIGIAQI